MSEESSRRPRGVPEGVTGVPTGVPGARADVRALTGPGSGRRDGKTRTDRNQHSAADARDAKVEMARSLNGIERKG